MPCQQWKYLESCISPSVLTRYPVPSYYFCNIPLHKYESLRRAFYDEFSWYFRSQKYRVALKEWLLHTRDLQFETKPQKQCELLHKWFPLSPLALSYDPSKDEEYTSHYYDEMYDALSRIFSMAQEHYQKEGTTHAAE